MTGADAMNVDVLCRFRHRPVHVAGAASAEGVAVARLLVRLGFVDIVLHDLRQREELRRAFRTAHSGLTRVEQDAVWDELRPLLDRGRFGSDYLSGMEGAALVSLGQGWRLDAANRTAIERALPAAARVTSMSELYIALAPGPVCGITGTNGKSTTVALVDQLLTHAGVPHRTAGNDRAISQFLHEITTLDPGTPIVLEISNRQLDQLGDGVPVAVAAITSLTPDHIGEHGGFDAYVAVKRRLFAGQSPEVTAVWCDDDEHCRTVAEASPAVHRLACGIGERAAPGVQWHGDALVVVDPAAAMPRSIARRDDLALLGDHNLRNAAVAVACALALGASVESIAGGLASFAGKSLRLEAVDTVRGVELYSDLKSTTPEATIAALTAFAGRDVTLIAGGEDKGLDYAPLARAIADAGVRTLLVPGSASDVLAGELIGHGVIVERFDLLGEALDELVASGSAGSIGIVSPAAAGFWTTQLQGRRSLRALIRDHQKMQEVPAP